MDIIKLLEDLKATIDGLQSALGDAKAAAEQIAKENYDKGFADGVASVPVDSEKKYTQADLDAAVQAVRDQTSAEVEALRLEIANLKSELEQAKRDVAGQIEQAVKSAIQSFKSELKAKFAEQQAKESADEAAFGALLDEVVVPEPTPEPEPQPEPEPEQPVEQ